MEDNKITVKDLFSNGLIDEPLEINAEVGREPVSAQLLSSGDVQMHGKTFESFEEAMQALPREENSTSNAWQFWSFYSEERNAWTPLEHLRAQLNTQQKPAEIKTSLSHPLRIDEVSLPETAGKLGLTFCPGKVCDGLYGGTWERDLETDLNAILGCNGSTLITLMETHEFDLLGVPQFPKTLAESKLNWLHLPIKDMQIPEESFETSWRNIAPSLYEKLKNGESIVIHCRGGLGRTGLLAARILTEWGIDPVESVRRIRDARPNSIETYSQERYVLTQAWKRTE